MRVLAYIVSTFMLSVSAFCAEYNFAPTDDWQKSIQTLPFGTNVVNLAAGTYQCTSGALTITNSWTTIAGSGSSSCWILGAAGKRVVQTSGNRVGVELRDMTITGGSVAGNGGGVSGTDSTYTIGLLRCSVVSNVASQSGGGAAYVVAVQSHFNFNVSTQYGGGAAYIYGESNCLCANVGGFGGGGVYNGRLTNCVLACNTGLSLGGGALETDLIGCSVVSNWSKTGGGGASGSRGSYGSTFAFNWAPYGGALNGAMVVTNCDIHHNSATNTTGGAALNSTLLGCRVSNNWAKTTGGGLQDGAAESTLFSDNYSLGNGSASYVSILRNCTVVGHTNATTATLSGQNNEVIANTLMWGNASNGIAGTTNIIACVFNSDPLFISGTFVPTATNVVDAGVNDYATYALDASGSIRIVNSIVDIGAYERQETKGDAPASAMRRRILMMLNGG